MKSWNDNPWVWAVTFKVLSTTGRPDEIIMNLPGHPIDHQILFSTPMIKSILEGRKTQTRRLIKTPKIKDAYGFIIASNPAKNRMAIAVDDHESHLELMDCPYGIPGDILWVRESWKPAAWNCQGYVNFEYKTGDSMSTETGVFPDDSDKEEAFYTKLCDLLDEAGLELNGDGNYECPADHLPWKPSIHMPKSACRIWLEITEVRIQRLQDISPEDAVSEGILSADCFNGMMYKDYQADASGYGHPDYDFPGVSDPIHSFRSLWNSINGPKPTKPKRRRARSRKEVSHDH